MAAAHVLSEAVHFTASVRRTSTVESIGKCPLTKVGLNRHWRSAASIAASIAGSVAGPVMVTSRRRDVPSFGASCRTRSAARHWPSTWRNRARGCVDFDADPKEVAGVFARMIEGDWSRRLYYNMIDHVSESAIAAHADLVVRIFLDGLAPAARSQKRRPSCGPGGAARPELHRFGRRSFPQHRRRRRGYTAARMEQQSSARRTP
jgi:hypothetical protein